VTHTIGTKASVEAVQADVDTLMGYPSRGVHVGGGRHVDMPETFTPGAPGWTEHHAAVRKHPKKDEYATELGDDVAAALADPQRRKRLTADKLAALEAKQAAVEELPADWNEQGDDDNG
jgi:hypothetical protein